RRVLLDLRDGQPPVPRVAIAVAADLARPPELVAPALAAVLVGGDDTGFGRHGRRVRFGLANSLAIRRRHPAVHHAGCHPLPGPSGGGWRTSLSGVSPPFSCGRPAR